MKLFTKEVDKQLFAQYPKGSDLENQMVVAKIFNPYGRGVWYLLNSDPEDPDYIWAIVDLFEPDMGSVSRSELQTVKVPPFGLGLERDIYFTPKPAKEVWEGVMKGERFAHGGMTAGRWYKDNSGNEFRFIGESEGKLLFKDGEKIVTKSEEDFEDAPKEKKLFGIFAEGGETEDEGVDLFEDYDDIPANVQKILQKYDFEEGDYRILEKAKKDVEKVGYTFEYSLDGTAYDLRKIGQKGKSEDEYAKGGETQEYIVWVSKDGEKRELFGEYKSKRAADMQMNKLWPKGEYKQMGNKPKSMYEKEGFYADGGRVKGKNNQTGESYGVVIGSVKKSDEDIDGGTEMNVRSSYSSRISEVKLLFDKNGNLYEITDYGYALEGNYPNTNRGSAHRYNADKKETLEVLSKKYNPAFAKKLIELAKGDKMADGGIVKYYDKDNEYKIGRPSGYIEKEILERVSHNEQEFVGSFGWKTSMGKMAEGYLYNLNDFDKNLVKDIKLKQGEKIFRYLNRTTAIGGMRPFIKINVDKALIYFLVNLQDDGIEFETRGIQANYIALITHKMAEGGMVQHGLKIGDKIVSDQFWDNQIVVENQKTKKRAQINLETGVRKEEMGMGGDTAAAEHNIKQAKYGARLVGKQKNLDVNKNGKLDAEDFKMLRGEKMAKGGEIGKHKWYVVSAKEDKVISKGFDSEEEAKKQMYELYEKNKDFSLATRKMAKGGEVKFEDKVKAVKESLLKRKKVSPKVQKDYGKTYNRKEALEAAKRIVGAQTAKWEKRNKK